MRIVLVTRKQDYFTDLNAEIYDSLSAITLIKPDDVLIINSYYDDEYRAGIALSKLIQSDLKYVLYLSDNPQLNMTSLVRSINGLVDTEEYLLDPDTLGVLIGEYKDTINLRKETTKYSTNAFEVAAITPSIIDETDTGSSQLLNHSSIEVVESFYHDFVHGTVDKANTAYLGLVSKAISDINGSSKTLNTYDKDVSDTVNDLYSRASEELSTLQAKKDELEEALDDVKDKYKKMTQQNKNIGLGRQIDNFAAYTHTAKVGTQVIVYKEYSQVRYLTSMILGYAAYLKSNMYKRVHVLFVIPNKPTIIKKYKKSTQNFVHVTTENYQSEDVVSEDILFTEMPVARIYKYLLSINDDILIIVDRTYNDEFCVNGRVNKWHAFSGKTEADLYPNINEHRVFPIKKISKDDVVIGHVDGYSTAPQNRKATYDRYFKEVFKSMTDKDDIEYNN